MLTTDILSWWKWRGWQMRWMVMMKWHRWKTKTLTSKEFMKNLSTVMNERTVMTYSTLKVKRKNALNDIIIDKKWHDYKYQGEFTRYWRQNSRDHTKKYSRRGDRMDVKIRTRKESFERKPQRDFADKTYDYSIDWRKANLTKNGCTQWDLKQACMKFGQWLCTIIN